MHADKRTRVLPISLLVEVKTNKVFQEKNTWSVTHTPLARNLIFKPPNLVFFQNRKVANFDEVPKSKRDERQCSLFVCVEYSTPMATNYEGFERYLPVSENQLREYHEKGAQNRCFPGNGSNLHIFLSLLVL